MKLRHKLAYMKAVRGGMTLDICPVRLNHIGLPRSGKSTFCRRIMGEISNIREAMEHGETFQASTGLAEVRGQVFIRNMHTNLGTIQAEGDWSVLNNLEEEASMLCQSIYLRAGENHPSSSSSSSTITSNSSPSSSSSPYSSAAKALPMKPCPSAASSEQSFLPKLWGKFLSLFDKGPGGKQDLEETFVILEEAMKEGETVKFLLDGMILLINSDMGGQAEFLDLQAALVLGPSLNFLYFRLVDELNRTFETYYTNKEGVSSKKECSTATVEQVLMQALSAVTCLGQSYWDEEDSTAGSPDASSVQSKVLIVGTHRDCVSEEELQRKDGLLRERIESTFFGRKIVEYASERRLMLAVDNMNGEKEEIDEVREIVEGIIRKSFPRVSIPVSWLMLSLCIRRRGVRTMSLGECESLAVKLRMGGEELQSVLYFLHHHIGVLLYFPDIPSLRGTIICDIQVVFDSASNLIRSTFTFEKVGYQASQDFREKAQFTLADVKRAASGHTDDLLPLVKLIDLLTHRNVLTILPSTPSSPTSEPTYFMPCVLKSTRAEELSAPEGRGSDPPSLMVRYNCGFVPIGVFPALISNLVSQQRQDWHMVNQGLRKNRIQFQVGMDYDLVTLLSHPGFLEVSICRREAAVVGCEAVCGYVRQVITSTLDSVTSHLNYRFRMQYKFGFACPLHLEGKSRDHICVINEASADSRFMECVKDLKKKELIRLHPQHKVWFLSKLSFQGTYSYLK